MAKSSITSIEVLEVREKSGLLGRRTQEDQFLRLDTAGGSVYLRKSAVEGAGDSWQRVKRRIENLAQEKDIPYRDTTKS